MPKGLKRALSALLIAVFLYSLIGFLILPGIALRIANQQLAQYANVPASLQRVQFNPFSLELSLWGLNIGEAEQEDLRVQRLYANLQADSLWSGALHLAEVELQGAHTAVLFDKEGKLNLAQLFRLPESDSQQQPSDSQPFPLRIDDLRLQENALRFQDLRPSEPVEFAYDALNLHLHNLSTLAGDDAEMTLTASGPYGARIDWQGQLSLTPAITSSGSLKISDGHLSTFWPYVRDAVPLVLKEGQIDLSGDYRLDLSSGTELQLSKVSAHLAPFAIDDPQGKPLARLQRLDIADSRLDLAKQQVLIGQVRSQGLEAWASREADGELDWQKLFTRPQKSEPEASEQANDTPGKPWQVRLADVQLRDYKAHLADRAPGQEVAVDVGPLNLDLANFDSLGDKPFTLRLDTGVGKQGKLQAKGEVQLQPTTARLEVATQDLDLRLAQAYLNPFIRLELRSGLLGSDLDVQLDGTTPLALSVTGDARIDQLHTLDTLRERDLVRWKQVRVNGIAYHHGESLVIERIELDQPYARFMINEDHSTNISELIVPQPASSKDDSGKALAVRIGGIAINGGSANFADFSLTPNFATAIQQLDGQIGTLDNQRPLAASVDISGKVDRYAPVSIQGQLTPFDPLNSLDIATHFRNVELTTITPYSGKFAGYRIRKGRLNLDLHYRIEQGQLNAENKVLVENLQLGEKVDSPDAVDLPVRLAVALLKDTQGRISIELPVKGNLNDPQFSVMPVVWQTLRNLVLRAAQAPFKFVAGLVGGSGDMDLSTVPFAAGSAELSGDARQALDTLAKALQERPTLRLEVEGQSAQHADGPLLAEQRLQREFRTTWYKVLQRRGDKVPASPDELTVDEDEQAALLEGIYRTRLKQQPPAQWAELDEEQRLQKMRQAVLDSWAQSQLLLRQLAQQRAAVIKDYLVEQGHLSDERVYLIDVNLTEPQADGRVLTALHLDSQ